MELRRKMKQIIKSFSVFALVICLLVAGMPVASATSVTVESIAVKNIEVIQYTEGYNSESYDDEIDDYVNWYYYDYTPEYEVVLSDGTILESDVDGDVWFEESWHSMICEDDQSYDNQWGLGTHTVNAEIFGISTQFNVTIVESPFKEVTINNVEVIENVDGYYLDEYDNENEEFLEWFCYDYSPEFTVTLQDGTVLESEYGWIGYNDKSYGLDITDDQSYYNQWTVGKHTLTAEILGVKTTFDVNVIESPVKEIAVEKVEFIENTNGYYESYLDENDNWIEWYRYQYSPEFTVTLKDGDTLESVWGEIKHNNKYYDLEIIDDQSYHNQWGTGTYTVTAKILGAETTFDVNVLESPVKEINIDSVEVIKNTDGYYDEYYDSETDELLNWYCYTYVPEFSVTLKDGTVLNSDDGWIEYEDEVIEIKVSDDQNYFNQWSTGTYTATASILGSEATFTVNVIESPVKEVTVNEPELIQYTSGYFENGDDNQEWFCYYYLPEYTVTLNDGTVLDSEDGEVEYKGEIYKLEVYDNQSSDNPWTVGTHTATAEILGTETTFNVKIIDSPCESFEILKVSPLVENDYYYGIPQFTYKVINKDGTSYTGEYINDDNYGDSNVSVYKNNNNHMSFQYESDSWTVGGDNEFTVYYLGLYDTAKVEILPTQYEYIEQNGGIYITSIADTNEEDMVIPAEIDGKKVIGIVSLGDNGYYTSFIKSITIPDSVVSIGQDTFKYCSEIEKINIGSGVTYLDANMFTNKYLKEINVSENNKNYCSIDGVVYDSAVTTLVAYPVGGSKEYVVPSTVSNIDVLDNFRYTNVNVTFSDTSKNYATVDGVTYTTDMKKVVRCNIDKTGSYEMPDSVVAIADNAFANCANLTDVTVSDNVTEIVYGAFVNCTSLSNVTIPNTVKKIGPYSFGNCSSLEVIDLPSDLELIDEGAFKYSGLKSLTVPDKVTDINTSAFAHSKVESITFGKNLKSIGDTAFNKVNITSLYIPDHVTHLGANAFSGCSNLSELTIGKGITTISENAFAGAGFTELVIPANVTSIGKTAFWGCENLNNLTIEGTEVNIGASAFYGCPLKNYDFNSNINVIGMHSFAFGKMESLSVSPTVTEISYRAFYKCENLSSIEIPDSVLKINGYTFDNTEWYDNQPNGEVYLDQIFYDYKGTMPKDTLITLKDGTVTIADCAFENCSGLKAITLPEGLKGIGKQTFTNCAQLSEIYIPASVEYIGDYAFAKCSSLTAINVSPDNKYFTSINGVLFNKDMTELIYCPKQNTGVYTVPESVKTIKTLAFDSQDFESVVITNSDTGLEDFAVGFCFRDSNVNCELYMVDTCNTIITCPAGSKAEEYVNKMHVKASLTESLENNELGDADNDGEVNIHDATLVQMQVARYKGENINLASCDVDKDGEITIQDATAIQMLVSKMIPNFESLKKS